VYYYIIYIYIIEYFLDD